MTVVPDALSIVMTKERRTLGIMTMSRSATLPLLHKFRGHITYFPSEFVKMRDVFPDLEVSAFFQPIIFRLLRIIDCMLHLP